MPFVQRNSSGKIVSSCANLQPGQAEEELHDDDPELVAYLSQFPTGFLTPPTEAEIARMNKTHERLQREHEAIRNNVIRFNAVFSHLETALSALLYSALNIQNSQVAYAIYFSPTGFDARAEIVDNVLKQFIFENKELTPLQPLWDQVFTRIQRARRIRNTIAHASPQTLIVNGRSHARLTAPAFDVIRLGRKIADRQIPGLTASDIAEAVQTAHSASERIDDVNRVFEAFYREHSALPQKLLALEAGLPTSRCQEQVVQVQTASSYQIPQSPE